MPRGGRRPIEYPEKWLTIVSGEELPLIGDSRQLIDFHANEGLLMTSTALDRQRAIKSITIALLTVLGLVAPRIYAAEPAATPAGPEGPAQVAYVPAKVPAPAVILLSGQTGPANYQPYAAEVAGLGYYAVLLDGKDILTRAQDGRSNLQKAITRAQGSPNVLPGKVAVIGFSQGGGGAILHAAEMPELVAAVVAYYPATSWSKNLAGVVKRFKVPVLVLAGERDTYNNCCLIEHMQTMETTARENAQPFELVVYPQAGHGFNLRGGSYRGDDAADAWRRTRDALARHLPVPR
jgi:dienelactone hydrolase